MDFLYSFYWIFSVLSTLAVIAYLIFIVLLTIGFYKWKVFQPSELEPKTTFTIVVPFRNEKENLPKLLASISRLNYPKNLVEVILVDDDSEEVFSFQSSVFSVKIVQNKRKSNSPKKDAIETAIEVAQNDWIITTDADCVVPENWLRIIDNYIQTESKRMVAAGVKYEPKKGFLHDFQSLDLLSLQGTTIGSFWLEEPFMCNGANFAYEKSFFYELNGFEGNNAIASGDDVFLLQKAVKYNQKAVGFCKNERAVVTTQTVNSWKDLFQQRVRWAAKTSKIKVLAGKTIALAVFGMNFLIVWEVLSTIFFAAFYGISNFYEFQYVVFSVLKLYFLKLFVDVFLLYGATRFFKVDLGGLFLSTLLYPFFSVSVALYSLFGKYEWKGRTFQK